MKAQLRRRLGAKARSAELHSAVSQICNLRAVGKFRGYLSWLRSAECNSAIRQIENLRYYLVGASARHALLHFHSSGVTHRRALTGLFTT